MGIRPGHQNSVAMPVISVPAVLITAEICNVTFNLTENTQLRSSVMMSVTRLRTWLDNKCHEV